MSMEVKEFFSTSVILNQSQGKNASNKQVPLIKQNILPSKCKRLNQKQVKFKSWIREQLFF